MEASPFNFFTDCTLIEPCIPPYFLDEALKTNDSSKVWERIKPFLSKKENTGVRKTTLKCEEFMTNSVMIFCNNDFHGTFSISKKDEQIQVEPRYGNVLVLGSEKVTLDLSNLTREIPIWIFSQSFISFPSPDSFKQRYMERRNIMNRHREREDRNRERIYSDYFRRREEESKGGIDKFLEQREIENRERFRINQFLEP